MSKKANPKLVGGFVVGAVALVVTGILIFGAGWFLTEKLTYVLFFDGSVKGLGVGAPVQLKGVTVGTVADIRVSLNTQDLSIRTPVYIEVKPARVSMVGGDTALLVVLEETSTEKVVDLLVQRGLRAQLQLGSLVTGQLLVAFDFFPGTPIHLTGLDTEHPELPTIPSDLEELSRAIEKLPLDELVDKAVLAVEGIERLVNSPDLLTSINSLNTTLKDVSSLARNLDGQVEPLTSSIEETMRNTRDLVRNVDRRIEPLAAGLDNSRDAAAATMEQAKSTLLTLERMTSEDSTFRYLFAETLTELAAAARSVRIMADYLQRHPESLLYGKGEATGKSR